MASGTVKFFNMQKGSRLHRADRRSKDVFVHISAGTPVAVQPA